MSEIVTVGWLTLDDIILPDRTYEPDIIGGGALYSAIGARIWHHSVGIHSVTGKDHLDKIRRDIGEWQIDTTGISAIDGNGLQLWILHESATAKQQIPKLSSSRALEMDQGRKSLPDKYKSVGRGFHIAPQGSSSTLANINCLSSLTSRPIITVDVLSDSYVDPQLYIDLEFLAGVAAFLPSEVEINRLWAPGDIESWLATQARKFDCHVAAKLGDQGSLVCEAGGKVVHRVPVFPVKVVDTTGAGDAYCGGFLAGLVDGRSVRECAAMGTVSASYVVEARGALATGRPKPDERNSRLASVISRIERG